MKEMNLEINILAVLAILFFHWLGDFVLQTDWQAKNKYNNWEALINHCFVYSCIATIPYWWLLSNLKYGAVTCLLCLILIFVTHTITDYFTSKLNNRLYKEGKIHLFFVSLGADQFYHFVQLLTIYILLR